MICGKCGNKVRAKHDTCPYCGNEIQRYVKEDHSAAYPSLLTYCASANKSLVLSAICWVLFFGVVGFGIPTLQSLAAGRDSIIIFVWFAFFVAALAVSAVNFVSIKNMFGSYFSLSIPSEVAMYEAGKKKLVISTFVCILPAVVSYILLVIIMGKIFLPGLKFW